MNQKSREKGYVEKNEQLAEAKDSKGKKKRFCGEEIAIGTNKGQQMTEAKIT